MKYTVKVSPLAVEDGGGFQALIPQFGRGIVGYGESHQEAVEDLITVLPEFLGALEETGQDVPEPEISRPVEEFSGKFNVRIPKVLHAELVDIAEDNEVSLNQMVTMLLTNAISVSRSGRLMGVFESSHSPISGTRVRWDMQEAGIQETVDLSLLFGNERNRDQWLEEAIA